MNGAMPPAPAPVPAPAPAPVATTRAAAPTFDPSEYPVAEVLAYLAEHPEDAARVLAMETVGKGRKSILYRGD